MRSQAVLAIVGGVVLALLLFVPVAAVRYRRSGRMTTADLVALVAVPVYGLALWTYTLLPLPDPASIVCQDAITRPFAFVDRVRTDWSGASPADLVRNAALLQVVMNVVLFVPLGALLRWRRRTGLPVTAVAGLATSLAIELTQLTGTWGLYRCAYRYFEVDDLLANTSGAVAGWVVVAVLVRHRPVARPAPTTVTPGRRLVGLACDALAMLLVGALAVVAWRAWLREGRGVPFVDQDLVDQARIQWGAAFAVEAVAVLAFGRTVGEWAVDVVPRTTGGRRWALPRRALRLLAGPGAVAVLAASDARLSDVAVVAFALLTLAAAVLAPRRGLAGLASGTELVPAPARPIRRRRDVEVAAPVDT